MDDITERVMKMAGAVGQIAKFLSKVILKVISHSLICGHILITAVQCGATWLRVQRGDCRTGGMPGSSQGAGFTKDYVTYSIL